MTSFGIGGWIGRRGHTVTANIKQGLVTYLVAPAVAIQARQGDATDKNNSKTYPFLFHLQYKANQGRIRHSKHVPGKKQSPRG